MQFNELKKFANKVSYNQQTIVFKGHNVAQSIHKDSKAGNFLYCKDDKKWEEVCTTYSFKLQFEDREMPVHIISVGTEFWKRHRNKEEELKMMMIHEVGHIKTHDINNSGPRSELYAQLWAIKRANQMGLLNVQKGLIRRLFEWQEYGNEYSGAYRIFRKEYREQYEIWKKMI